MKRRCGSAKGTSKRKKLDSRQNPTDSQDKEQGYEHDMPDKIVQSSGSMAETSTFKPRNRYQEYFEYKTENSVKYGICQLCGEKDVKIKMQRSNTSGLKWHLKIKHKIIHDQLFPNAIMVVDKAQKTLEEVFANSQQKGVSKTFNSISVH